MSPASSFHFLNRFVLVGYDELYQSELDKGQTNLNFYEL